MRLCARHQEALRCYSLQCIWILRNYRHCEKNTRWRMVFFALLDDEVEMIKSCICEQSKSIDYVLPLRYSSCLLFALLIRPIMDEKLKLSKYWCLS